jgi:hypothetical protein
LCSIFDLEHSLLFFFDMSSPLVVHARCEWRHEMARVRLLFDIDKDSQHICWRPMTALATDPAAIRIEEEAIRDCSPKTMDEDDPQPVVWLKPLGALQERIPHRLWGCWTCGRTHECRLGEEDEDDSSSSSTGDPCIMIVNEAMERVCAFSGRVHDAIYLDAEGYHDSKQKDAELYASDRDGSAARWASIGDTKRMYRHAQFMAERTVRNHAYQRRLTDRHLRRAERLMKDAETTTPEDEEERKRVGKIELGLGPRCHDGRVEKQSDKEAWTTLTSAEGGCFPAHADLGHWRKNPTPLMRALLDLSPEERLLLSSRKEEEKEERKLPRAPLGMPPSTLDGRLLQQIRGQEESVQADAHLNPIWLHAVRPTDEWVTELWALFRAFVDWLPLDDASKRLVNVDGHVDRMARWVWLMHILRPATQVRHVVLLAAYLINLALSRHVVVDGTGREWPLTGIDPVLLELAQVATLVFTGHDEAERDEIMMGLSGQPARNKKRARGASSSSAKKHHHHQPVTLTLRDQYSSTNHMAIVGSTASSFRSLGAAPADASTMTAVSSPTVVEEQLEEEEEQEEEEEEEEEEQAPSSLIELVRAKMMMAASTPEEEEEGSGRPPRRRRLLSSSSPNQLPFEPTESRCTLKQARDMAILFLEAIGGSIAIGPKATSIARGRRLAAPFFFQWFHSPARRLWPLKVPLATAAARRSVTTAAAPVFVRPRERRPLPSPWAVISASPSSFSLSLPPPAQ